jgi:NAD(P)-dependent dehydrogenase (short-subunit alcohol dehydrogenase family)
MPTTDARKTILIVGVRGLGHTIAVHFATQGWRVVCAARSSESVSAAATAVDAAGGQGIAAICDLQDPSTLARVVASEARLDLVIAAQTAGGRFGPRPLLETEDSELDRVLTAYVRGSWNLLKAVGPKLVQQAHGTFLQIGTSSGVRTKDGWAPLGCAQHGLRALVQVAAREWRPQGVHVAYLPIDGGIARAPSIESPPRALAPTEIARACDYLHHQAPTAWTHELVLRPTATDWTAPT